MGYNILDAIREEITLCKELEQMCKSMDKHLIAMCYREQASSLNRILRRVEKGIVYSVNGSEYKIEQEESDRKSDEVLERENIALQKAGEHYRMVRALIEN